MPRLALLTAAILALGSVPATAIAGNDFFEAFKRYMGQSGAAGSTAGSNGAVALGQNEIVAGLRQALSQGTRSAIAQLGRSDGFWKDARVKIPLPTLLGRYEGMLRNVGYGAQLEQFQLTMNRAAEQAVPQVATIFGNAIGQMTVADAQSILKGQNDAATQFFRRTAGPQLFDRIRPLVATQTATIGVTQQYKQLTAKAGPYLQLAGQTAPVDLDTFVTDKAMDGLFTKIADEESRIRADPAARGTEILKKVFASR